MRFCSSFRYPIKGLFSKAELKVVTDVQDQEIYSKMPLFTKYESGNRVTGTYEGKETKGYCYVEHLGKWK